MPAKKTVRKPRKKKDVVEYTASRASIIQKEVAAGEFILKIRILGSKKVTKEMILKDIEDLEAMF